MLLNNKQFQKREYYIPESDQILQISSSTLNVFEQYKQTKNENEAGGLLFARFQFPIIIIEEATIPHIKDSRTRFSFIPYKKRTNSLIRDKFSSGLHFIGEWHTHPEENPSPSSMDLNSMRDSFIQSRHELDYFVMIIVGNCINDLSLWVGLHSNDRYIKLFGYT